jgi:5'-nucleotidase
MALDLSTVLVIGVSSRSLFDLEEENRVFEKQGIQAYKEYQLQREGKILKPGTAFPLVNSLLKLNSLNPEKRVVEVIVMSHNTPDISLRISKSIEYHNLDISRMVFTGNESLTPYLEAFDVDLFLSKYESNVQAWVTHEFFVRGQYTKIQSNYIPFSSKI